MRIRAYAREKATAATLAKTNASTKGKKECCCLEFGRETDCFYYCLWSLDVSNVKKTFFFYLQVGKINNLSSPTGRLVAR